jgi:hypothetical protein
MLFEVDATKEYMREGARSLTWPKEWSCSWAALASLVVAYVGGCLLVAASQTLLMVEAMVSRAVRPIDLKFLDQDTEAWALQKELEIRSSRVEAPSSCASQLPHSHRQLLHTTTKTKTQVFSAVASVDGSL